MHYILSVMEVAILLYLCLASIVDMVIYAVITDSEDPLHALIFGIMHRLQHCRLSLCILQAHQTLVLLLVLAMMMTCTDGIFFSSKWFIDPIFI